ncbi:MAG: HAD-IB family phosphatase, partial [Parcubacteria group bacterium]
KKYLIIDFDSTIIKTETLEELAEEALRKNENKGNILKEISHITDLGMEGKISFSESLERRLKMIELDRDILDRVKDELSGKISDSILENDHFFRKNAGMIHIISSGFRELILPVAEKLGILAENISANDFVSDGSGRIIGVDKENPMSGDGGKINSLRDLDLDGKIIMVGDGWTDYETKDSGAADLFIAYTENVRRDNVCEKADYVAKNFDEVIKFFNSY